MLFFAAPSQMALKRNQGLSMRCCSFKNRCHQIVYLWFFPLAPYYWGPRNGDVHYGNILVSGPSYSAPNRCIGFQRSRLLWIAAKMPVFEILFGATRITSVLLPTNNCERIMTTVIWDVFNIFFRCFKRRHTFWKP